MLTDDDYFNDEMREEAMNANDANLVDILIDNGAICYSCGDQICTLKKAQGVPTYCKRCWEVYGG